MHRGYIALTAADPDRAASVFAECELVCRAADERFALATARIGHVQLELARGRLTEAHAQIEQVDHEVRELRMPWMRGVVLNTRARLALAGDDAGTVTRVMTEAIDILSGLQDSWAIRYPLAYLATAAAMRSKPRRAAVLYGVADAFSERSGNVSTFPVPQQVADRYRAQVEAELGAALFEELVEQGRALPLQQALTLASEVSE